MSTAVPHTNHALQAVLLATDAKAPPDGRTVAVELFSRAPHMRMPTLDPQEIDPTHTDGRRVYVYTAEYTGREVDESPLSTADVTAAVGRAGIGGADGVLVTLSDTGIETEYFRAGV